MKALGLKLILLLLIFTLSIGAGASWWNDSYDYRTSINITESSGEDLRDYQAKININTSSLISEGKMQSDCSDLRFANSSDYELDYWIESGCNTDSTDVWVKLPGIESSSQKKIYAYYGNSEASNGEAVIGTESMPAYSCRSIYEHGYSSGDGTYFIDPDGGEISDGFETYCDMNSGGYTLVMKLEGTSSTFDYSSSYWENSQTLNTDDILPSSNNDAKFEPYNSLEVNELRAEFPSINHVMDESFSQSKTPLQLFSNRNIIGHETYNGGVGTYGDFNSNDFAYQSGYQDYGFKLDRCSRNVRWGWVWNNEENTCDTVDSVAGIGLTYVDTNVAQSGSYSTCCSNTPSGAETGTFGLRSLVWGQTPEGAIFSDDKTSSDVGAERASFCDKRGLRNECIINSEKNLSSQEQEIGEEFYAEKSSIFNAVIHPAEISVSNNSYLSGVWRGSFNIISDKIIIRSGAKFRPENGRIILN